MARPSNSGNRLLVAVNWLLVMVGGLLVGQTAHTLFFSQSQFKEDLLGTQGSALSPSPETTVNVIPPVLGADDSSKRPESSTKAAAQRPSTLQPAPGSGAKGKARPAPRVQNPNRDRLIDYDRAPTSEADRLGL